MKIACFHKDITPPLGHPLCAGWYPKAEAISERLSARGVIMTQEGDAPVVLCALDWAELSNLEYFRWQEALARAAGTTPERVAIHCVHCHDAPWPDEEAQAILDSFDMPGVIMEREWCRDVRAAVAPTVARAREQLEPVDRLRFGWSKVPRLASNRRPLGADGKVIGVRWTQCRDAALRALPEGVIDPYLRTVSFWHGGRKRAALHYYTTHPTSYDATGVVTTDFPGIARERLGREEGVPHLYFTGCAGNITPGKYNDGVANNRLLFADKIYTAMRSAEAHAEELPVARYEWRTAPVCLPPLLAPDNEQLLERIRNPGESIKVASRAALELAYRQRIDRPITISALNFGPEAVLLHLPGEAFVEYQLYAQSLRPEAWMGVASYGDLGPGYICMASSFEEGGYEPKDAFCGPESEPLLKEAIRRVLQ